MTSKSCRKNVGVRSTRPVSDSMRCTASLQLSSCRSCFELSFTESARSAYVRGRLPWRSVQVVAENYGKRVVPGAHVMYLINHDQREVLHTQLSRLQAVDALPPCRAQHVETRQSLADFAYAHTPSEALFSAARLSE